MKNILNIVDTDAVKVKEIMNNEMIKHKNSTFCKKKKKKKK